MKEALRQAQTLRTGTAKIPTPSADPVLGDTGQAKFNDPNGVATNCGVGLGGEGPKGGTEFLGWGSQPLTTTNVVFGSTVSSHRGVRAHPRPPKGFLVFFVIRLPFPASQ